MKIGILGAGGMGRVHARHLSRLSDVELSFYETDSTRADEFASLFPAKRIESVIQLIEGADVVDVCLPTHLHEEYALMAIEGGKAVFIEKPIAATVESAERIAEAAAHADVVVGVGQVVRYFPEFRAARDLVAAGKIGKPAAARTRRGGKMPATAWFANHELSGGVLIDLAVHDFDWLRWTLGEVDEVFAQSVGAASGNGPDYALTTLRFRNGAIGHVEATWMDPSGFRTTFEVCGSGGMVEYDSRTTAAVRFSSESASGAESPLAAADDPYFNELKDFLQAVASGSPPPVGGTDGVAALRIAEAATMSAKSGQPVKLTS